MSLIDWKHVPWSFRFNVGNWKKSHEAKPGENNGWSMVYVAVLVLNLVTNEVVHDDALSCWKICETFFHNFSTSAKKFIVKSGEYSEYGSNSKYNSCLLGYWFRPVTRCIVNFGLEQFFFIRINKAMINHTRKITYCKYIVL